MQSIARPRTQYSFPYLREPRLQYQPSTFPFEITLVLRRRRCMGTSPIMPCYDVEQLEPKTHMGLDPGESIKYTKHRVSLEDHPWLGCHPIRILGVNIVMDRPSKEGAWTMLVKWTRKIAIKQKGLWPALQGHPGCKTLQMWTARTSRLPHKCLSDPAT